jgi:Sec-independent protein translocase protein TatA
MRQEATPTMDDLFTQRHLLILLLMLLVIFGTPKLKALLVYLRIM